AVAHAAPVIGAGRDGLELAADAVVRGDGVAAAAVGFEGEAADGFIDGGASGQAVVGEAEGVELDLAAFGVEVDELAALGPHRLVERVGPAVREGALAVGPGGGVVALEADGERAGELEVDGVGEDAAGGDVDGVAREEADGLAEQVAQAVAGDAAEDAVEITRDPLGAHEGAERILERDGGRAADEDGAAHGNGKS